MLILSVVCIYFTLSSLGPAVPGAVQTLNSSSAAPFPRCSRFMQGSVLDSYLLQIFLVSAEPVKCACVCIWWGRKFP